jgi:cytochrome P450
MKITVMLAIVAIVWAMWRPLRAALSPGFARAYPDLAAKLRLAFGLLAILLLLTLVALPGALWLGAACAVIFIALQRWRARPSWGQRRGLPPGSLEIFPASWADDRFYLKRASEYGAIFKTSNFLRPTACVVGLERGIEILREHEDKLETPFLPFSEFVPGGMLRYMREPQHQHYRSILRRALAAKLVQEFDSAFAADIRNTLDLMCEEGLANPSGIHPLPYLDRMMRELWFLLFFAIERDSAEWQRLLASYPIIDITNPTNASPKQIRAAVSDVAEIVELQLANWCDQAPPCLLAAISADNPANARDPVVIGNLIYMLATTGADMSALLCWILKMASDHPQWLERIAGETAVVGSAASPSLAERFVMETLRMRQSEFIYRAVIHDLDYGGFHIPKGWLLRICVWESHRDPAVFPDPDCFNPDRFLNRTYTRSEYSPFGAASHACVATYLVTSVARTFVNQLATGFAFSSPSAGAAELASSRHWTPGSAFRTQLVKQR